MKTYRLKTLCIIPALLLLLSACGRQPAAVPEKAPAAPSAAPEAVISAGNDETDTSDTGSFNDILLKVVSETEPGGGYYTGYNIPEGFDGSAWTGLDAAVDLSGDKPVIDLGLARPSFCSAACYAAVLKALLEWDTESVISREAWTALKPYTLQEGDAGYDASHPYQHDGYGCWGRANANASGFASLIRELGAGSSFYISPRSGYATEQEYTDAWSACRPGDIVKLFWNEYIGADDSAGASEAGHLVVFLSLTEAYDASGRRDDIISYWSSNGSGLMPDGGYGAGSCRTSEIFRAVCTRITDPGAFDNAAGISPGDCDEWLAALDGERLGTEEELISSIS